MRSLFISGFIVLGLILDGESSFALARQYTVYVVPMTTEIPGQVADYNGPQGILTIRDKNAGIHLIEIPDSRMVRDLRIGDNVVVRVQNGEAVSIERVRGY
ncbi:MAG: hypothetical protein ACM3SR_08680 [Ignavibacteriales bacterium]